MTTHGCPQHAASANPTCFSPQPALLHQTPAQNLDKFICEFLQPDRHFLTQVKRAVDTICSFLKENCFRNSTIKVLKVVKVRPRELQGWGLVWGGAALQPPGGL